MSTATEQKDYSYHSNLDISKKWSMAEINTQVFKYFKGGQDDRLNDKEYEFYIYDGGGHNLVSPYFDQAMLRTVKFFEDNL